MTELIRLRGHGGTPSSAVAGGRQSSFGRVGFQKSNMKVLSHHNSLENIRTKLPSLEPQQLDSVFNEAIRKIEIAAALPFTIEHFSRFKNVLGSSLVEQLESHKIVMESYQELLSCAEQRKEEIKALGVIQGDKTVEDEQGAAADIEEIVNITDDVKLAWTERKMTPVGMERSFSQLQMINRNADLVMKKMQFSFKNTLRLFAQNGLAYKTITQDGDLKMPEDMAKLISLLRTLKMIFSRKLSMTPQEHLLHKQMIKSFSEREESNAKTISHLENEVALAQDETNDLINSENDKICQLKKTLDKIRKQHEEQLVRLKSEGHKQELTYKKNGESKVLKLKEELEQVGAKYETLVEVHHREEAQLRKKKFKVEDELASLIENYDKEMLKRQDEIEEIEAVYAKEKTQLELMEVKFRALEEEYNVIVEERKIAKERRDAEEKELRQLTRAATTIQSIWRSYKVNKAIKTKKKKAGKGANASQKKKKV